METAYHKNASQLQIKNIFIHTMYISTNNSAKKM